jgi:hypothetical protein
MGGGAGAGCLIARIKTPPLKAFVAPRLPRGVDKKKVAPRLQGSMGCGGATPKRRCHGAACVLSPQTAKVAEKLAGLGLHVKQYEQIGAICGVRSMTVVISVTKAILDQVNRAFPKVHPGASGLLLDKIRFTATRRHGRW